MGSFQNTTVRVFQIREHPAKIVKFGKYEILTSRTKQTSGPGCSKLTTSLVSVLLKFHALISEIHHYFLLKNCEKLLHCKSFSHCFNKKFQCI